MAAVLDGTAAGKSIICISVGVKRGVGASCSMHWAVGTEGGA
jgi:hypothetical protein